MEHDFGLLRAAPVNGLFNALVLVLAYGTRGALARQVRS